MHRKQQKTAFMNIRIETCNYNILLMKNMSHSYNLYEPRSGKTGLNAFRTGLSRTTLTASTGFSHGRLLKRKYHAEKAENVSTDEHVQIK